MMKRPCVSAGDLILEFPRAVSAAALELPLVGKLALGIKRAVTDERLHALLERVVLTRLMTPLAVQLGNRPHFRGGEIIVLGHDKFSRLSLTIEESEETHVSLPRTRLTVSSMQTRSERCLKIALGSRYSRSLPFLWKRLRLPSTLCMLHYS